MQEQLDHATRDLDEDGSSLLNDVATFLCLTMFVLIVAAAIFLMSYSVSISVDAGGACLNAGN